MKNNIKQFREEKRLTQEELAILVNVSRQTIISLEKFKYVASLQLAYKLAKVFNTSIESLFEFEDL